MRGHAVVQPAADRYGTRGNAGGLPGAPAHRAGRRRGAAPEKS